MFDATLDNKFFCITSILKLQENEEISFRLNEQTYLFAEREGDVLKVDVDSEDTIVDAYDLELTDIRAASDTLEDIFDANVKGDITYSDIFRTFEGILFLGIMVTMMIVLALL